MVFTLCSENLVSGALLWSPDPETPTHQHRCERSKGETNTKKLFQVPEERCPGSQDNWQFASNDSCLQSPPIHHCAIRYISTCTSSHCLKGKVMYFTLRTLQRRLEKDPGTIRPGILSSRSVNFTQPVLLSACEVDAAHKHSKGQYHCSRQPRWLSSHHTEPSEAKSCPATHCTTISVTAHSQSWCVVRAEPERQTQGTCSGHRLRREYTPQKFRETQITSHARFPPTSIKLQGQDGPLRTHLRLLLTPQSSRPTTHCLVASRWGPDSGSHYLWPSLSPPLCQEEQPPREYAFLSVWLLQNSFLSPNGNMVLSLARIKPHETKKFLELNWAIYFIEKEKRNLQTPWLVQLDKRITFEVWNVK